MLTFKQRYRPRTTREYTKSDLTVYDSAGNTALNTLKVYGKSEVVDGAIKSAGEGWSTVRLADLTWTTYAEFPHRFAANVNDAIFNRRPRIAICSQYPNSLIVWDKIPDKHFNLGQPVINAGRSAIAINDTDYTTVEDFVASLGDATLAYQLADPSQGNAIAIKTDDGTGIDGTMAVFTTGTPLYGVSDTARDVMTWDGSTGAVTKNCGETYPAQGNIIYWSVNDVFILTSLNFKLDSSLMCPKFQFKKIKLNWGELSDGEFGNTPNTRQIGFKYSQAQGNIDAFKAYIDNMPLIYELATPTTEQLTQTENTSIASLRTFDGTTHFTNNASTDMSVNYTIKVPTIS